MVSVWNAYHSQYFVLPHYQVANQTRKRDLKLMPGAISNTIKHFSRKKVCLRYWHRLNAPVSIVKEEPRLSPGTEVCVCHFLILTWGVLHELRPRTPEEMLRTVTQDVRIAKGLNTWREPLGFAGKKHSKFKTPGRALAI